MFLFSWICSSQNHAPASFLIPSTPFLFVKKTLNCTAALNVLPLQFLPLHLLSWSADTPVLYHRQQPGELVISCYQLNPPLPYYVKSNCGFLSFPSVHIYSPCHLLSFLPTPAHGSPTWPDELMASRITFQTTIIQGSTLDVRPLCLSEAK